jgi:general secretion pathway protein K
VNRARQQGIVLILVLWALVLLTVIVSAVSSSVHTETTLAHYQLDRTRLRAQADAAFLYAAARAFDPDTERAWSVDAHAYRWSFEGRELVIHLQAERDRLDLNQVTEEQLRSLLAALEVEPDRQTSLVAAMLDWRDRDNLHRLNGAEDDDYRSAGLSYGAKDAPYDSVDEIGLVLGMTPDLKARMFPYLAVSGRGDTGVSSHLPGGFGGAKAGFSVRNGVWVWVEIPSGGEWFRALGLVRHETDRLHLDELNYGVSQAEWPVFEEE